MSRVVRTIGDYYSDFPVVLVFAHLAAFHAGQVEGQIAFSLFHPIESYICEDCFPMDIWTHYDGWALEDVPGALWTRADRANRIQRLAHERNSA